MLVLLAPDEEGIEGEYEDEEHIQETHGQIIYTSLETSVGWVERGHQGEYHIYYLSMS